MTTKNDVTGDSMVSKETTDVYRNNWDAIFGKPKGPPKGDAFDEACEAAMKHRKKIKGDSFDKAGEMSMERYENAYKKLGESK